MQQRRTKQLIRFKQRTGTGMHARKQPRTHLRGGFSDSARLCVLSLGLQKQMRYDHSTSAQPKREPTFAAASAWTSAAERAA
jgi:hypothetical protein